jgi:streptogramin lyase
VTKVAPDGSLFTSYSCCDGPSGVAIDQRGNVWVANYYGNSISEISSAGAVVSNGYVGGGVNHPQAIAIDGAGTVWIANFRSPSLTELAGAAAAAPGTALSPAGGLGADAALLEAYAIAVDASGNLWTTNFGSNILTEFIGVAVPVKTPLIALPAAP